MKAKLAACLLFASASLGAAPPPLNFQTDIDMSGPPQSVYFMEKDMAKGQSTGLHIHHGIEMNVVLQGTLRVTIGNDPPVIVRKGDSLKIPREVPHVAVNIGRDTAKLIITYVVDTGRPLKESWPPAKP